MKQAWDLFAERMEDRAAAAFRLVERLSAMDEVAAKVLLWEKLADMDATMLRHAVRALEIAWLRLKLDGKDEAFPARVQLKGYQQLCQDELTRRELAIPSTQEISNEKLQAYTQLIDSFDRQQQAMRPNRALANFVAFEVLLAQVDSALALEPHSYLYEDLQQIYVDSLANMGECQANLHDGQATQTYYEAAITRAEESQLAPLVRKYRLKLADYFFTHSKQFNQGLQVLLPEWLALHTAAPSLDRVELCSQLATAYLKVDDNVEATNMRDHLLNDLPRLGFALPERSNLEQSLAQWIETAYRLEKDAVRFLACLHTVLKAYIKIASLESRLANNPEAQERGNEQMQALMELRLQLDEQIKSIEARDRAYLETLSSMGYVSVENEFAEFEQQRQSFMLRYNALVKRSAENENEPATMAEAQALEKEARLLGNKQFAGMLLDLQADILGANDQWDLVPSRLNLAIEEALDEQRIEDALYFYKKLINAHFAAKDNVKIDQICTEAIALVEAYRYHLGSSYQQNAYMEEKIWFYQLGAFTAWKNEDYDLLLQRIALSKSSASMRQFLVGKSRGQIAGETDFEGEIASIDAQIIAASKSAKIVLQEKRRKLFDLLGTQKSIDDALPVPTLKAVQASLKADEALCSYYWLGGEVLLIIGITRDAIEIVRQIFDEESLNALHQLLTDLSELEGMQPIDEGRLNAMGQILLPAPIRKLIAGKKRLTISPHQSLHLFPFQSIQYEGNYLFARFALTYIPNLTALLVSLPKHEGHKTLAMGVANFRVPDTKLATIPGAMQEVLALRELYNELDIWVNDEANVEQIRAYAKQGKLSSYDLIHLALHGENASQNASTPMETKLFLQDGAIDGLEISQWQLNADLIVLSACHSGRRGSRGRTINEGRAADELFGLQAAFFAAGARQILGALWPASDQATQMIMGAFHECLQAMEPAFALQAAMLQYLERDHHIMTPGMTRNLFYEGSAYQEGETYKTNPVYWAPFFLTRICS